MFKRLVNSDISSNICVSPSLFFIIVFQSLPLSKLTTTNAFENFGSQIEADLYKCFQEQYYTDLPHFLLLQLFLSSTSGEHMS